MSWKMRTSLLLFLLVPAIGFCQSVNQRQEDSITAAWNKKILGKPLPAFVASGAEGIVTSDSLKGKVTLINIWEASCAPCMAEMSTLNKLYDTLSNYPDFQFISISSDDYFTIRYVKETFHVEFKVYHLDQDGCYQLNDGEGYPTTLILDRKGNVVYARAGGYTDKPAIWKLVFVTDIYPAIMNLIGEN